MIRILLAAAVIGVVVTGAARAIGQEEEKEHPTSYWMQKKLEYSQEILNGLATEDFPEIRKSAAAMKRLSRIEGFVRRTDTKQYRTQLHIFDFANNELLQAAEDKNIERAALAFTQLTLSCVNCHKAIRQAGDLQP
jgi:hypothetical protein